MILYLGQRQFGLLFGKFFEGEFEDLGVLPCTWRGRVQLQYQDGDSKILWKGGEEEEEEGEDY